MLLKVARKSLLNRRFTVLLTVLSVAVGVFTLLGVEHIRHQAKNSFTSSVSGIDLIVGARTSPTNLLLYSVFRIGNATNNISWDSYQHFTNHPQVAWTIPVSLGDSHRGYRVMGTSTDYFNQFRYGQSTPLAFSDGGPFAHTLDVVVGAEVARRLNYDIGDTLVLAHGLGQTSFTMHDEQPFTVVGILAPTGTPVDQTLHVSLAGLEAVHMTPSKEANEPLIPSSITAFMVGLDSKIATFQVQRHINDYQREPLTAVLPGVAMSQLWQMVGSIEKVLQLISLLVFAASMLGLSAMLMASMRERQREMAVLRAIGAGPGFLFFILQTEGLLIVITGTLLALGALQLGLPLAETALARHFGLLIDSNLITGNSLKMLALVIISTVVVGLIPSLSAYRQSLHHGLAQKH